MNNKVKILIIDDDKGICEGLRDHLELEGYLVATAYTSRNGIEHLKGAFFNIVLLDKRLPDSDGIIVLESIKEISPDTEVILLTAYASTDSIIKAMDKDVFSYLSKPFKIPELITTIKKACEKQYMLFENRKLFQQIVEGKKDWENTFDSISELISIYDKDFTLTKCNSAFINKINAKYENVIGKKCNEIFCDRNEPCTTCIFVRCRETLKSEIEEGNFMGGIYTFTCFPRLDEEGEFIGVVHVAIDITEKKQAERRLNAQYLVTKALAESVTMQEASPRILETICMALDWCLGEIWMVDPQGKYLRNSGIWHIPSLKIPEFKSIATQIIFTLQTGLPGLVWGNAKPIWIQDVARYKPFLRMSVAAKEGLHGAFGFPILSDEKVLGVICFFSRKIKEPDKDLLEMISSVGVRIGLFIKYRQVQDLLQEKERQIRLFMLSINDGIWNWDMVADTVERSVGFEMAFGYTPEEIDPGIEWWRERLHPDDRDRVLQIFNDAVSDMVETCSYEYRFRCNNGSYVDIEDRVYIIRDCSGKAVRSFGAMRDITERKTAVKALEEQKIALEQKNIALHEVLGLIEIEKKQIKDNVMASAENLIMPVIQKLRLKGESLKYVKLLQKTMQELTSSFGTKLTEKSAGLTSREIEVCNMIKNGLTSKEIARLLNINLRTTEKHRANIRNKLGIINKDINLTSYLKTL